MEYSATSRAMLSRNDLIELEPLLCKTLARFFSFTTHGLYFPCENIPQEPQWLPRERKLLLPLAADGQTLGILMIGGVASKNMRSLLPLLPGIVDLCLENLLLLKRARRDSLTDLFTREALLAGAVGELEQGRRRYAENLEGRELPLPPQQGSMGIIVLRWVGMAELAASHGHNFADALRRELADALTANRPHGALAARCAENEFALLLREPAIRAACEHAGAALLRKLDASVHAGPLTREPVRPRLSIGYAVYPQDIEGEYFLQPYEEQLAMLLAKARLAAGAAEKRAYGAPEQNTPLAYARIVHEGGFIQEILPLSRLFVSLGLDAGAQAGLRFSIWPAAAADAPNPRSKGEIVLLHLENDKALAELVQLDDPVNMPAPGDVLRLVPETPEPFAGWAGDMPSAEPRDEGASPDKNGLLPLEHFRMRLADAANGFCIALLHAPHQLHEAELVSRIAGMCRSHTHPDCMARYGARSFLMLHSASAPEKLSLDYGAALRKLDIQAAVGLAPFPYLHFERGELIGCCSKALELARLLPAPHVGIFGSLAMNISADKHYSKGELFKAVEEYEWALLADRDNANAWNSLGFCMASLSRHHDARRYFSEALKRNPGDTAALYNLGMACFALDKQNAARRYFNACLKHRPDHVFAHIRLGQMAARAGRISSARRRFLRAAEHREGAGLAHRLLARLALRGNTPALAREYLHEALLHNPQDALAMHMLAKLYLDCGEDPSVAEMLARQSVALMPESGAAWQELGRSLKAQGRETEAAAARARAARA